MNKEPVIFVPILILLTVEPTKIFLMIGNGQVKQPRVGVQIGHTLAT